MLWDYIKGYIGNDGKENGNYGDSRGYKDSI